MSKKTKVDWKICNNCEKEYDRNDLIRSLGEESQPVIRGFCSAYCYTQACIQAKANKIVEDNLEKLAQECIELYDEDISAIEANFNNLRGQYPPSTLKPRWKDSFTSADAVVFAKQLAEWEAAQKEIDDKRVQWNGLKAWHDQVIKRCIEIICGLDDVPAQYRDKVWYHAWQDGHSYGWHEVKCKLESLVEIFND